MKNIVIVLCVIFVFSFIYYLLQKLDDFLAEDQSAIVPKEKRKK